MIRRAWGDPFVTQTLTYDIENRLIAVSGLITATFLYDPTGARVQSVVDGSRTDFAGNWSAWDSA